MDFGSKAIDQAKSLRGKIEVVTKVPVENASDLSTAYTPGVATVSMEIAKDPTRAYELTIKGNSVAVVSDGSAVLGLGNIGPEAALPVMEGKALLFKEFGGIDAYPIVLATQDVDEIVAVVRAIAPGFAGVNLEDISAPRCFEVEERLQDIGIPVFHDDQHGTAIVILAAIQNALEVVGKGMSEAKVVIVGAGASGIATARMLSDARIVLIDSLGVINRNRGDLNRFKAQVMAAPNYEYAGSIHDALKGADIYVGLSGNAKLLAEEIALMAPDPIIMALSNPTPEILPGEAAAAGAAVVATGRSDFANQINNVLAFPGVFRGAIDGGFPRITEAMKLAAARALAGMVKKPTREVIIPSSLDRTVARVVAEAVRRAGVVELG